MMRSLNEQVLNSEKNTDIKCPKGDKLFIVYNFHYLLEYSTIEKKTVHYFGRILQKYNTMPWSISAMVKTPDKKS